MKEILKENYNKSFENIWLTLKKFELVKKFWRNVIHDRELRRDLTCDGDFEGIWLIKKSFKEFDLR